MDNKVTISLVRPVCGLDERGICEAYQILADNHRLAREQAISALRSIRKIASERGRGESSWDRDILSAIDDACAGTLRQWGAEV